MIPNMQLVDQGLTTVPNTKSFMYKMMEGSSQTLKEVMSPPTIATVSSISFFLLIFACCLVFYYNVKEHKMVKRKFHPFFDQFLGFLFGGVKWLRSLIIGQDAPLKVIQDSIQLLGYAPFHQYPFLL